MSSGLLCPDPDEMLAADLALFCSTRDFAPSRYTGNYGLGTRVLDRVLGTEWSDYEALYDRVNAERRPLSHLRELVEERDRP